MQSAQLQMGLFASIVAIMSVVSLVYIALAQPDSLRKTREGVAYFTSPVEHPDTGEPITLDVLIEHYKGQ